MIDKENPRRFVINGQEYDCIPNGGGEDDLADQTQGKTVPVFFSLCPIGAFQVYSACDRGNGIGKANRAISSNDR